MQKKAKPRLQVCHGSYNPLTNGDGNGDGKNFFIEFTYFKGHWLDNNHDVCKARTGPAKNMLQHVELISQSNYFASPTQ